MAIRIDTLSYESSTGHKPRQPKGYLTSPWAFQIDLDPKVVLITASYKDAVKQAKKLAEYSIKVLP